MSRLSSLRSVIRLDSRPFSTTSVAPGWTGRTRDDHVVKRTDKKDAQSDPAQQALQEKTEGNSDSHAISGKGGEGNKKAESDRQKAPKPVIGMNDERGAKS